MRIVFLSAFALLFLQVHAQEKLISFVNPMIGTQLMGHTFPGATVPFGLVQLSPDTDTIPYSTDGQYNKTVYEYCAGYQYDDPTIAGFSHTHFSGTGHSDLGDFLIMASNGPLQLNPGTADRPESGYRSRFSHSTEVASPGYYSVFLEDPQIRAEMTTTTRVGVHRYTPDQAGKMHIILDMMHSIYNYPGKTVWTFIRVENDTLVTGYRQTNGWGRTRVLYFAMAFNKPILQYGHKKYDQVIYRGFYRRFDETTDFPEMAGENIRAWFDFDLAIGEPLIIRMALSGVSTEGAILNLQTETPDSDFEKVKLNAEKIWEKELSVIKSNSLNINDKKVFYTALYHTMIAPAVFTDVDGKYRGLDQNIHAADGFTNYTIFSLWDTYRALHPLFNIIQPERNADMVESMLVHYDQSVHPFLPVWSHYANENWCMTGYHSVSVISDAIVKGVYKGDVNRALNACTNTASYLMYDGINWYESLGFIPEDKTGSSVSKTLEYAYDDWTIARLALAAGDSAVWENYMERSQRYKSVFNPATRFMAPRLTDGNWKTGFDPLNTHSAGFIEGNSWNYTWHVPQAVDELIVMTGGKKKFVARLDSLFSQSLDDSHFAETEDITREGIMGLYVHGNEPGHHIPYLYAMAGSPEKTQFRVRKIMSKMYFNETDGLCGNDDCGQMSAWYVFSALGFYPVCPGSDEYILGSPLVIDAEVSLGNGKTISIKTRNQSAENVYVRKVLWNGKEITDSRIKHSDLMQGGTLEFIMSKKP